MTNDEYFMQADEYEAAEIEDQEAAWQEAQAILSGEIPATPETREQVKQWMGR